MDICSGIINYKHIYKLKDKNKNNKFMYGFIFTFINNDLNLIHNKKIILYSNKFETFTKSFSSRPNDLCTVYFTNDYSEIKLHHIIGPVSDFNCVKIALLNYSPKFPIKPFKFKNLDNFNELPLFLTNDIYTITIDPIGCIDIDDAVSYIDEHNFIIHIANPSIYSHFINDYYDNITSIYFYDKTQHLLPELFSTNLISLIQHKIRSVISIYINLDCNNDYKPNIIKVCINNIAVNKNYSYDEANNILFNNNDSIIANLFNLSSKLIPYYYKNGQKLIDTHQMIELFMLCSNHLIGNYLYINNCNPIFRSSTDDGFGQYSLINNYHKYLELENYIHFTSPIRRIIDYINLLKLIRFIDLDKFINNEILDIEKYDLNYINEYNVVLKKVINKINYVELCKNIDNNNDCVIFNCCLKKIINKVIFCWLINDLNIVIYSKLCNELFIDDFKNIIDSLIINDNYDIKLFVSINKYNIPKILFSFN